MWFQAPQTSLAAWFIDLFEHAYDLIQCVDEHGRLLYVNQAWKRALGYADAELEQLSIWQVIHPEHHEPCMQAFQQIMRGEPLEHVETVFVGKQGQEIAVEGCATLCRNPDLPIHTRGIFRDITERKRRERERERLVAELQQALQEIRSLQGLLPVCAWCKKIRRDHDYWQSVEDYLARLQGTEVTHAICPDCLQAVSHDWGLLTTGQESK